LKKASLIAPDGSRVSQASLIGDVALSKCQLVLNDRAYTLKGSIGENLLFSFSFSFLFTFFFFFLQSRPEAFLEIDNFAWKL
jgi:hypothetical protein